jgi:serine protease
VLADMKRARVPLAAIGGLVVTLAVATASPALSAPPERPDPETRRAIVTVSTPDLPNGRSAAERQRWKQLRGRSSALLAEVAERNGLPVKTSVPEIGMLSVELGDGGLAALRAELADEPRVESVRPDRPFELRYQPNDFAFTHLDSHAPGGDFGQWHLLRSGAPRAWDFSKGSGAEVTVIDTGANGSHPDLAGRIVGGAAYGLGFGEGGALVDEIGHGTHTAGLACADSDNSFGIASMGFDCSLFIEKLGSLALCSDVGDAIADAGTRFTDVISMSLGNCGSELGSALAYALSRGSVPVAAGANSPTPDPASNFPAQWVQPEGTGPQVGFDRGVVVTAAKYDGTRAIWAQQTTGVSVAGLGSASDSESGGQQGILSTFPPPVVDFDSLDSRTTVDGDNRFAYLVGTSMATPQVAGLAALIRAVKPSLPAPQVAHLIKETANGCGTYGGGIGWGVVRADHAVAAALGKEIDLPSSNVRSAKVARRAAAAGLASTSRAKGRVINLRLKREDAAACAKDLPVSGLKTVAIFASANGGRFRRVAKTNKKKVRFRAKRGRLYRFYSIAVDKDGNREAPPPAADAKAKVKG